MDRVLSVQTMNWPVGVELGTLGRVGLEEVNGQTGQRRFHRREISRDSFPNRAMVALGLKRTVLAQSASAERLASRRPGDSTLLVVSPSEATQHVLRATCCRRCFGQRPLESSFVTRSSRFEPPRFWTLSFDYLSLSTTLL